MKRLLATIFIFLSMIGIVNAQIDADTDNNNYIDEAYGGTNASALNAIVAPLTGRIGVTDDANDHTVTATEACGYLIVESGDGYAITLPELTGATTTGYNICVLVTGADSSCHVHVTPNAADYIDIDGTTFTQGYYIQNTPDLKEDYICLLAVGATTWVVMSRSGTWVTQ